MMAIKNRRICGWDLGLMALTVGVCAVLYRLASAAPEDGPGWLLRPVAWLAGGMARTQFVLTPGVGYIAQRVSGCVVCIHNACSGVRFQLMLTVLLVFTCVPRIPGAGRKMATTAGAMVAAYGIGILATALRIASATVLWIPINPLDPVLLHNAVGVLVYLTATILCFVLATKATQYLQSQAKGAPHG